MGTGIKCMPLRFYKIQWLLIRYIVVMCEITIQIKCPNCNDTRVKKNGIKRTGQQDFLCHNCRKQFQCLYHGANAA